jgi:MFS family permease
VTGSAPQDVAAVADSDVAAHTSAFRARLELFVVGFAALVVSLSQTLLVPVLPTLPVALGTSAANVEWLLTVTVLVGAIAVPIMGRLGDMFGKRRLLLSALATLVVGSFITALTSNYTLLITGRALQGVSLAVVPLGISLLSSLLPAERVGAGIAVVSAMLGVGGALALPLSGVIAEHYDFHVVFWITAVAGALSLIGVLAIVPESSVRKGGRVDFVGAVLLSIGLISLLLPLAESGTWGWGDPRIPVLLVVAVAVLALFGWVQTRTRQPLVDMSVLRRRPIVLTNLASTLFGFALFASLIGTAAYVEAPAATGYGFDSSLVVGGLAMLPSGLAMLVLAPVAARLIARYGAALTLALGAAIVAIGWLMRILVVDTLWQVILGSAVVGIGTGTGYASIPTLIAKYAPADEIAAANGLNTLFRSVGSALASAIGGSLLAGDIVVNGLDLPSLASYRQLFGLCAAAALLAAGTVLLIPRQKPGVSSAGTGMIPSP